MIKTEPKATLVVKARMRGARGKARMPKAGAIMSTDPRFLEKYPDGVRPLKARDIGKLSARLEYYRKKGIPVTYVPAEQVKEALADFEEHKAKVLQRREAEAKQKEILERRRGPDPIAGNIKDVEAELAKQRGQKGAETSIVEVLKERMSKWTKPKKGAQLIDPAFVDEFRKLEKERRTLARATAGESVKQKRFASPEYDALVRRMDQLRTKRGAQRAGGGHAPIKGADKEQQFMLVEADYVDLGFHPSDRPMTYLLTVGDWPRKKGKLKFNANEHNALLNEYGRMIGSTVNRIANAFDMEEDAKNDLKQDANVLFWEMVNEYDPDKEIPGPGSNIARFLYGLFPSRLKDHAKREAKRKGQEVLVDELEDMPLNARGEKHTPAVRYETPEQAVSRKDMERNVKRIFSATLSPIQELIVTSRLNIFDHKEQGVADAMHEWPVHGEDEKADKKKLKGRQNKAQATTKKELMGFGLKTWKDVRQDVKNYIADLQMTPKGRKDAKRYLNVISRDASLKARFGSAMKLLQHAEEGLDTSDRRTLAQLANMHQQQLQGIRHQVGSPERVITTAEGVKKKFLFGKLITKRKPHDPKVEEKAKRDYEAAKKRAGATMLTYQKTKRKHGAHSKAAARSLTIHTTANEKKLEASRKLIESRGLSHTHMGVEHGVLDPTKTAFRIRPADFWNKRSKDVAVGNLASQLNISTKYADYFTTKNVTLPPALESQRIRAEGYHKLLMDLKGATLPQLRARVGRGNIPTKVGKYKVNVSRQNYDAMLHYWISKKSGTAKKSFVLLDYGAAWGALIEECALWEMNGL